MANPLDLDAVTARIKTLLNTQLKNVCRDQGLPVSGTKSDLQRRLFSRERFRLMLSDSRADH